MPFNRQRTKPILDAVGLRNEAPAGFLSLGADASRHAPGDDVIDIDATSTQLQLIRPAILWVQGMKIANRVTGFVKRITDRILPPQSVSQYDNNEKQSAERRRIIVELTRYLGQVN